MANTPREEIIRAFYMMWDNYPEQVRLIDRGFNVLAGNRAYLAAGGQVKVKCNVGDPEMHRGCQAMAALKSGETKSIRHGGDMYVESFWVPVAGEEDYYVHFTNGLNEAIAKMMEVQKQ